MDVLRALNLTPQSGTLRQMEAMPSCSQSGRDVPLDLHGHVRRLCSCSCDPVYFGTETALRCAASSMEVFSTAGSTCISCCPACTAQALGTAKKGALGMLLCLRDVQALALRQAHAEILRESSSTSRLGIRCSAFRVPCGASQGVRRVALKKRTGPAGPSLSLARHRTASARSPSKQSSCAVAFAAFTAFAARSRRSQWLWLRRWRWRFQVV